MMAVMIVMVVIMMLIFFVFVVVVVMLMLIVIVMMVMVLVLVVIVMVVVVMMLVLIIVIIVVPVMVMMMMPVLFAVLVIVMMVMVVMLFLFFLVVGLRHNRGEHLLSQRVVLRHRGHDHVARQLIPRRGDDARLLVVLAQQGHDGFQLLLRQVLRAGEQDGARVLDLVEEELAEVLHVHTAFHRVRHRDEAAHLGLVDVALHAFHRADHVAELAHAGGLDEDAVGMILIDHLAKRLAEVAHQAAADAAGVHLGHLDARFLHEAAVDADLAELVLDEHDLLARKGLLQQLLDQRRLSGPEEAGENIDFRHVAFISLVHGGIPPSAKFRKHILLLFVKKYKTLRDTSPAQRICSRTR